MNGFVEIANTGSSTAVLDGISLVLRNGGDGWSMREST